MTGAMAGDSMHAPTLTIGDLMIPLWRGTFECEKTDRVIDWPWAILKGAVWVNHGKAVVHARQYMPGSYNHSPRNIAEKANSGYKAKEWPGYLYGLGPALLHGILPKEYWQNFCQLVSALIAAQKNLDKFHVGFETLYVQRRANWIHFVQPCIHAMLHLGLEVPRLGPPILHSSWTIERVIGDMGGEIHQPSNPYANLSERGLICCQLNALKAILPELDKPKPVARYATVDFGGGYKLLTAQEHVAKVHTGHVGIAVQAYMVREDGANADADVGIKIRRWARLALPNGQIAWCAWKECNKPPSKLKLEGQIEYAEVLFYFCIDVDSTNKGLAVVLLYSRPDEQLLRDSYFTL
ncbi:hypothetical protein K439DRAFT_1616023 [Ramaria rubella]|nr:hypothetical protein K439DRAFT_1616023 [Ramaria rubella]